MKHDEWALTKELGELRQFGLFLQARRSEKEIKNDKYDIIFQGTTKILEPYCSIEEVIGITNSIKTCMQIIKERNYI